MGLTATPPIDNVATMVFTIQSNGADWFRRWDLEVEFATRVASDSLNGGNKRTAKNEQFALAA